MYYKLMRCIPPKKLKASISIKMPLDREEILYSLNTHTSSLHVILRIAKEMIYLEGQFSIMDR